MHKSTAGRLCWLHQGHACREIPLFHKTLRTVTQQQGHLASHWALHINKTNRRIKATNRLKTQLEVTPTFSHSVPIPWLNELIVAFLYMNIEMLSCKRAHSSLRQTLSSTSQETNSTSLHHCAPRGVYISFYRGERSTTQVSASQL